MIEARSRPRFCVYCGSSPGADPAFLEAARSLGRAMASRQIDLVYGGASIGLMGAVADAVLSEGGQVIGVMPQSLADKEIAHQGLTELVITTSMHERKTRMADLSDGFIALPGGLGTLEELFEIWTWSQLGFHANPVALLNVSGYYDALISFLDQATGAGFVKAAHRDVLITGNDPGSVISQMQQYEPQSIPKVMSPER